MSAESVVYALLTGAGAVTSIVGTRIYPEVLPEKQPTPAIVYEQISSTRTGAIAVDALAGSHLTRTRVQINLLSSDHAVTRTLRAAVVAALQFQRGVIGGITVHSVLHAGEGPVSFDQALGLYHRPVDFLITHEST
jgi:hypothetical protein